MINLMSGNKKYIHLNDVLDVEIQIKQENQRRGSEVISKVEVLNLSNFYSTVEIMYAL